MWMLAGMLCVMWMLMSIIFLYDYSDDLLRRALYAARGG